MKNTMIELDSFQSKGEKIRIENPKEAGEQIMKHWHKFWSNYSFNEIKEMPKAFYFNYQGNQNDPYSFLVGLSPENSKELENQEILNIPKQKYVIFEKTGEMPQAVFECWKEVWESKLDRAFTIDFEEYPNPNTIKIYIAIKN